MAVSRSTPRSLSPRFGSGRRPWTFRKDLSPFRPEPARPSIGPERKEPPLDTEVAMGPRVSTEGARWEFPAFPDSDLARHLKESLFGPRTPNHRPPHGRLQEGCRFLCPPRGCGRRGSSRPTRRRPPRHGTPLGSGSGRGRRDLKLGDETCDHPDIVRHDTYHPDIVRHDTYRRRCGDPPLRTKTTHERTFLGV